MTSAASEPETIGTQGFCGDCPYWDFFRATDREGRKMGWCRRMPPVPLPSAGQVHPSTHEAGWCGEHPVRQRPPSEIYDTDAKPWRGAARGPRAVGPFAVRVDPCPGCGAAPLQACKTNCSERRARKRAADAAGKAKGA